MSITRAPNINHLWAQLLIEELIRNGVTYFCIAPGSRSSPLTTAAAQNPDAQTFVHFDERGLAFHALGYSAAAQRPAALICTSGTAAANFFPAVIEASKKKLPLIILTADRPPELRHTGADQTMDQVRLFGTYVRWEYDLPCPTKEIAPEFVLTTIDQAVHRAKNNLPGPVHINCMYREPLAPVKTQANFNDYCRNLISWEAKEDAFTQYINASAELPDFKIKPLQKTIADIKTGILAAGKLSSVQEQRAIIKLSEKLNWPIFPDITSGLRLGVSHPNVIPYFDQLLLTEAMDHLLPVDGVIQCGGRMTSKRWQEFLAQKQLHAYIMVLNHPLRNDPLHNVTHRIESGIIPFAESIIKGLPQRAPDKFLAHLRTASQRLHGVIDQELTVTDKLSEPAVVRSVSEHIPATTSLFLANSMPIRDADMYARPDKNPVTVTANRGVSGIDGNVASAAGFAAGTNQAVTLIIGDLALLHDINSLSMFTKLTQPVITVVINNNGGGIFSFLPVAELGDVFEQYFGTPHNLTFKSAADMFGLEYHCPSGQKEFITAYKKLLHDKRSGMIEVRTNRHENAKLHHDLQKTVRLTLSKQFQKRPSQKVSV